MGDTSEVAIFKSVRRKRLDNPGPDMEAWAKRVHGLLEHVPQSGDVVELTRTATKSAPADQKPLKPAYDVQITSGAKLDYRNPQIPPGQSQEVRPESCPPRTRPIKFEDALRLWLPQLEAQVFEAEKVLAELRKRSDNGSTMIPRLVEHIEVLRNCTTAVREALRTHH